MGENGINKRLDKSIKNDRTYYQSRKNTWHNY